jgi:hypothetical protein
MGRYVPQIELIGRKTKMSEGKNRVANTEEQIRERAYEIYVAGGREDGHDLSDWLTAERELKELSQTAAATRRARSAAAGK